MDFIVALPKTSTGCDSIVTFVDDKFTKMVHFAPTTSTIDAPRVANLFYETVVHIHGQPSAIVSDRKWFCANDMLANYQATHPSSVEDNTF